MPRGPQDDPTRFNAVGEGLILPLVMAGALNDGDTFQIVVPWDLHIDRVSIRADGVTNPGDGDVTVDVQDDGSSILTSVLSVAAVDTTVEETGIDTEVASGSILSIVLALTGTSPALSDLVVTIS